MNILTALKHLVMKSFVGTDCMSYIFTFCIFSQPCSQTNVSRTSPHYSHPPDRAHLPVFESINPSVVSGAHILGGDCPGGGKSSTFAAARYVKAKFHYAIRVANLAFDKFVWVCDQLATFLDRKLVADRFELSRHVEMARTCLRQVGNQVCDRSATWIA